MGLMDEVRGVQRTPEDLRQSYITQRKSWISTKIKEKARAGLREHYQAVSIDHHHKCASLIIAWLKSEGFRVEVVQGWDRESPLSKYYHITW